MIIVYMFVGELEIHVRTKCVNKSMQNTAFNQQMKTNGLENAQGNVDSNIGLRFDVEGNSLKVVQVEILLGGTRIIA